MSILIIDYGGSSVKQIQKILTVLGVTTKIINPTALFPEEDKFIGVILSGGPDHVYEEDSRKLPSWIEEIKIPVLGICYGMQLLIHYIFKCRVVKLPDIEFGQIPIHSIKYDKLLGIFTTEAVWMNHYDGILEVDNTDLEVTSISHNGYVSSFNDGEKYWGLQFHPESTTDGKQIFKNFLDICNNKI